MCMIDKQRISLVTTLESRLHQLRYHPRGGEWIAATGLAYVGPTPRSFVPAGALDCCAHEVQSHPR